MKKTITFQALFDDLPPDMIAAFPVEEDDIGTATVERIWQKTSRACGMAGARQKRRRIKWFLPAVAVFLTAMIITCGAMVYHWFSPSYGFQPPTIRVEPIIPLVEQYEHAVDINAVTEHDNVRVTLDKYVLDTVGGTLRLLIHFETTDSKPLTELSAERISQIVRTSFKNATLTVSDANAETASLRDIGSNGMIMRRSDAGDQPNRATFECRYYYDQSGNKSLIGKTISLSMTDFCDEVEVTKDLGFTYESMKALYDDMTPAERSHYIQGSERIAWGDGTYDYYHTLKETKQKIRFSTTFKDAYIDNIGFRTDLSFDFDSELYVSFVGLSAQENLPALVDTRNGEVYYGMKDPKNDGDRITLIYPNLTPEMLPYLFMMQAQGFETVVRATGTWDLSFVVEEAMSVRTFDVDADLNYHEYDYHVTHLEMTDSSLYFEGEYTVTPVSDGETSYASIYGTIDLLMADGTVLENPFYQGPNADIHEVSKGSGTTRWGGEFLQFIDSSQIVAVIALGETIPLV